MHTVLLASTSETDIVMMAIIFGSAFGFAVIATVASTFQKVLQTREREKSRREIAAYVAEGSIAPDEAARILSAGGKLKDRIAESIRS